MVNNGPYIDIVPVDPNFYYVPYSTRPLCSSRRVRVSRVGLGIHFGPGIGLGAAFAPWGGTAAAFASAGGNMRFSSITGRGWACARATFIHNMPRYERGGFDRREMHERREGGRERR